MYHLTMFFRTHTHTHEILRLCAENWNRFTRQIDKAANNKRPKSTNKIRTNEQTNEKSKKHSAEEEPTEKLHTHVKKGMKENETM